LLHIFIAADEPVGTLAGRLLELVGAVSVSFRNSVFGNSGKASLSMRKAFATAG
jgi:hypothetical protein